MYPFRFRICQEPNLRPAVILADVGRSDWILVRLRVIRTEMSISVQITDGSLESGSLRVTSYARAGKLFTANEDLIASQVGILNSDSFEAIVESVVAILRSARDTSF